jgi:hypothetical protein
MKQIYVPNGSSIDCLRMSIVVETRTRSDSSTSFSSIMPVTKNAIAFITKQGHYFQAETSSTTGNATLSKLVYRFVQATNTLEETNSVKINNNSKGVTIKTTDDNAHPSAILDVQNDSLGVLIPRIVKAKRPVSPATGLLVYQIDNTPGFYYYDGTGWRILGSSPSARIAADESSQSGTGTLKNGSVFIKFNSPIKNPDNALIQLQLEGDCNGVFIAKKTSEGFVVKELKDGKSNAKFNYTINQK